MKFRWRWHLLLLPLAALAGTAPLILHGVSCGHDFDFHIDNWIEVAQQWKQGITWPHWDVSANFGAGEPRFVFYPPLSWMLGALLGIIFGWNIAPAAYVFISLLAAAVSMYLLAREYAERRAAVIAAVLYATNPYMMFVVYERAAYAELLAAAWMPLVVLYALRPKIDVRPLALAIALCWLTNGPAGVMATYAVALLLLFRVLAERDWKNLLRGCAAVALGIALSAFYLWPAAIERRWIQIENALTDDSGPYTSFLFGHVGTAEHIVVLHTASWLAVILFVTAAISYAIAGRQRSGGLLAMPAMLLGVFLLLMLPVSAFVWRHAPQLPFLQFPWRLLVVVAVLTALGLSVALTRAGKYAWLALALAALSVATSYPHFRQYCDEEDVVPAQITAIESGRGVEGSDEYSPRDSDSSNLKSGMPHAWLAKDANAPPPKDDDTARISVREWSTEERRMVVRADQSGYLVVRMMDFPAWHLRIDGHDMPAQMRTTQRDDGLLAVPVAEGVKRLDLVYREPEDVLRGRLISLSAALLLLVMSAYEARKPVANSQQSTASTTL
jgi:hypothetical protein